MDGPAILIGCVWSLFEAEKFAGNKPGLESVVALRPENILLTRYAYFVFPTRPRYFTDGVTDPELENRFRALSTDDLLLSNIESILNASDRFPSERLVASGHGDSSSLSANLDPQQHYLLVFNSMSSSDRGVLQILGSSIRREYALPEFGGSYSFGAGAPHSHVIPAWTSSALRDCATIRFVPLPSADSGTPKLLDDVQ